MNKSIIPPTGEFGQNWPANFNLPQGGSGYISAAGWTYGNEGFIQQTFLGASIRNFSISAGFGDTSSTLSVSLVEDEYNVSDKTGLGIGDDVYHNGQNDDFIPPAVGSPVFFKFGKTFATVEQAWRPIFDAVYKTNTLNDDDTINRTKDSEFPIPLEEGVYIDLEQSNISESGNKNYSVVEQNIFKTSGYTGDRNDPANTTARGRKHIVFGGILQSYVENKGFDGNPLYSAQIVDPREILSNTAVILSNYAGSIFNNKNYFNVYGFLEYDPSDGLKQQFESLSLAGYNVGSIESSATWVSTGTKRNNILEKVVDKTTGQIFYFGNDMYRFPSSTGFNVDGLPEFFPVTGQGFSRRSEKGIPWYRVRQALNALFNYNGALPFEYLDKGFGGPINFRGYNYVVDFTGIPIEKIPQMYFLEFDQIDLLSLCQELCDVISHDLFITLLPVINHPASEFLYNLNGYYSKNDPSKIIAGIIRVDAIDRSAPPRIGVIKEYLDSLTDAGIPITNQDLGYELSNIPTDKIVAGAQEIDMYFFTSNKIRDNLQFRKFKAGQANTYEALQIEQWNLETSLKQQILPFYGFLGKDTPTIPIGFGPYQQILLDSSAVDAYGVGNYYIATELELRHALESYESWSQFLLQYNETYVEELTEDRIFWNSLPGINSSQTQYPKEFGVSAPRCVFISDRNKVDINGYPVSPCAPPYGYPLYYKRAERIGIPQAGVIKIQGEYNQVLTNLNIAEDIAKNRDELRISQGQISSLINIIKFTGKRTPEELAELAKLQSQLENLNSQIRAAENAKQEAVAIRRVVNNSSTFISSLNSLASTSAKNAKKVYDFVRGVAEKHLGKTFLVKIPTECNLNYSPIIQIENGFLQINNILAGPYGFKPLPINGNINQIYQDQNIANLRNNILATDPTSKFEHYLNYNKSFKYTYGALKGNFSPISDDWEFNYKPSADGGFFNYSIFDRNISFSDLNAIENTSRVPLAQTQLLAPMDLTNFQNNSKIKAYVRFDHSEYIDLSSIGKQNIAQQTITAAGFVPDVLEELNNINVDSNESFNQIQKRIAYENKPPSVAFVTCEVDEQFYLIPQLVQQTTPVFARQINMISRKLPPSIEKTVTNGCEGYKIVEQQPVDLFLMPQNGGVDGTKVSRLDFARYYDPTLDSNIIQTEKKYLNNQHVYAIITLPDKAIPTIDQRYMDGPFQNVNATSIKHTLTIDVVRGAPGFDQPAPFTNYAGPRIINCNNFTLSAINAANVAQQEAMRAIGFTESNRINLSQPSPVYPDLVVLPLMSMERCYGPWLSSSIFNGQTNGGIRYSDIGGKVEFVKDENLAPWNFSGYQLMNEAGALQAQFSNSLLLFSERGGFTVPDIPAGIILAKPLTGDYGPLVTSISVDVADNSVQTTIKMDLYTSRFGKLQKMKEDAIGKITRERQKINDQNNLIKRRGILKTATAVKTFDLNAIRSTTAISSFANRSPTHLVTTPRGTELMTREQIAERAGTVGNLGQAHLGNTLIQTGGIALDNQYSPASEQPHPKLPSVSNPLPEPSRFV